MSLDAFTPVIVSVFLIVFVLLIILTAALGYSFNSKYSENHLIDGLSFCFVQDRLPFIRGFLYQPAIPMGEPDEVELRQFHEVWYAAKRLWGDKVEEMLAKNAITVWLIREPTTLVGYMLGVHPWNEIGQRYYRDDPVRADPTKQGWGGAVVRNISRGWMDIYVSTYHLGRSVQSLWAHELVHALFDVRDRTAEADLYEDALMLEVGINS